MLKGITAPEYEVLVPWIIGSLSVRNDIAVPREVTPFRHRMCNPVCGFGAKDSKPGPSSFMVAVVEGRESVPVCPVALKVHTSSPIVLVFHVVEV